MYMYVLNKFHARNRCFEYALNAFGTRFRHASIRDFNGQPGIGNWLER